MWRVEREGARLDLADREVTLGAGQALGEEPFASLPIGIGHQREALAEPQRGLHRVGEPRTLRLRLGAATHDETVDDHFDGVLLHLVEGDVLGEVTDEPVDANAGEAAAAGGREELLVLPLPIAHERTEHEDARALGHRHDLVDDLLDGLRHDRDAVIRAVRHPDPREEKTQVVVDLGDCPDRRSRIACRPLLIDGYSGREALDEVDVGLFHLTKELARVRRERLDVAALTFGIDGVERERRLPRSRKPGDHDHLVPRDADVDVLEVVLARTFDVDVIEWHQATVGDEGDVVRRARCTSQR